MAIFWRKRNYIIYTILFQQIVFCSPCRRAKCPCCPLFPEKCPFDTTELDEFANSVQEAVQLPWVVTTIYVLTLPFYFPSISRPPFLFSLFSLFFIQIRSSFIFVLMLWSVQYRSLLRWKLPKKYKIRKIYKFQYRSFNDIFVHIFASFRNTVSAFPCNFFYKIRRTKTWTLSLFFFSSNSWKTAFSF